MNRFSSGMPALHSPFIPSSWMKFTTSANVRRSTCDCDSVIVRCTIDSCFDASALKPHPCGSVIPRITTPTTKFIPWQYPMSGKYSFSERSTFSSMI